MSRPDPLHVAPRACNTCPYRRDTPPGIWSAEEYEKLREFDCDAPPTLALFLCHQTNATGVETACRGWLSTHGDHAAVRLAVARGTIRAADVPPDTEAERAAHYATGNEAAEAGLAAVEAPSPEAVHAARKLVRRRAGRWERGA